MDLLACLFLEECGGREFAVIFYCDRKMKKEFIPTHLSLYLVRRMLQLEKTWGRNGTSKACSFSLWKNSLFSLVRFLILYTKKAISWEICF